MWERFSYYGMRALLVLYMVDFLIKRAQDGTTHVLGFAGLQHTIEGVYGPLGIQPLASEIYGLYTAFGLPHSAVWRHAGRPDSGAAQDGGRSARVLMAIGHFLDGVESMFLVALLFLILGNGCFKPNISTQVGGLYPRATRAWIAPIRSFMRA